MRRKDFLCEDKELISAFLEQIEFGVMAIANENTPYAVPISFCFREDEIYFHGAAAGRKFELLKNEPRVSFNAVKSFSYIPSQFLNHTMIPTQFFFSVFIEGRFEVVKEIQKRKQILENLVQKYEPNNRQISMDQGPFKDKGVFIGVIKAEILKAKAKFGQNMDDEKLRF